MTAAFELWSDRTSSSVTLVHCESFWAILEAATERRGSLWKASSSSWGETLETYTGKKSNSNDERMEETAEQELTMKSPLLQLERDFGNTHWRHDNWRRHRGETQFERLPLQLGRDFEKEQNFLQTIIELNWAIESLNLRHISWKTWSQDWPNCKCSYVMI